MGFNLRDTPDTAAFVLAMRAEGLECTVTFVSENGFEHGTPSSGDYQQVTPVSAKE